MTRQEDKQAAIGKLRELLKPGDTVYTIIRNRSSDDSYRALHVLIATAEWREIAKIIRITELVCAASGFRFDHRLGALGIGGRFASDQQAGEAVASRLSEVLFGVGSGGLKHQLL